MNKYLLLILMIISTLAQSEQKIITLLNDPFAVPKYVPCTDLESQLISQLSLWQFRGYIADHDMGNSMKIFLQSSKTKTWLAISIINNKIGRASCRERVKSSEVAGSLKKKKKERKEKRDQSTDS